MAMASYRSWLLDGVDLPFLEVFGWMIIGHGLLTVIGDLFNISKSNIISYGRYDNDDKGTKFKVPAKVAWFVMEMPSFVIPTFLILNVGGNYVGEFNPNIVLLGMFILHYFNRLAY